MLKKEFKRKDVQRARNLIMGNSGASTGTQIGYTKETKDYKEGDQIEDRDNEGKDIEFLEYSQDDKWRFTVTVSVEANYELSGNIQDVNWDTLEIDLDEAKAMELDNEEGKPFGFDDIPDDLREHLKKLAGIIK